MFLAKSAEGNGAFETSRSTLVLIAVMKPWVSDTKEPNKDIVFLLMTFLTPAKLSWSSGTYPEEAGDAACRTSSAGLHGQAPPEKPQEKLTPKEGKVSAPHYKVQ